MRIIKEKMLQRLAQIIEQSGYLTKSEFCEAMGVSPQVLGNLQNPNSNRDIPKSLIIGLAYRGYNLQWLLWGIGKEIRNG